MSNVETLLIGNTTFIPEGINSWNKAKQESLKLIQEQGFSTESPVILVKEGEPLTQEMVWNIGLQSLLKESLSRNERGRGTRLSAEGSESIRFTEADIWFAAYVDLAKRASNGLKKNIFLCPDGEYSSFGVTCQIARENPKHSDHNYPHERRVERMVDALGFNTKDIRENIEGHTFIDSLYLFANWHDTAQVVRLERNLQRVEKKQKPLHVKEGHDFESAIMMMAMYKRYAKERRITEDEAFKKVAGMVFMDLTHDEPGLFDRGIDSRVSAIRENETISELYDRFFDTSKGAPLVDRTTLTPHLIMELYMEKLRRFALKDSKNKFAHVLEESTYGLDADFEKEYATELAELYQKNEAILPDLSEQSREQLIKLAKVANKADRVEYIFPAFEAILRKLPNQYASLRPLFSTNKEYLLEYAQDIRKKRKQPPFHPKTSELDLMMFIGQHGDANLPNGVDSCSLRSVFEVLEVKPEEGEYLNHLGRDTSIMYATAFHEFGKALMIGDCNYIDTIMLLNGRKLGEKILRKNNLSMSFPEELSDRQVIKEIYVALQGSGRKAEAEHYESLLHTLSHIRNDVIDKVSGKPLSQSTNQTITVDVNPLFPTDTQAPRTVQLELYDANQRQMFDRVMKRVLGKLKKRFDVPKRMMSEYRRLVLKGQYSPLVPYDTYYTTTVDLTKIRTIVEEDPRIRLAMISFSQPAKLTA